MSEPPPFSPTVALLAVTRAWEAALSDALKPLGLTISRYALLGHIRRSPGLSFSELARRSRITVQSAHTAVTGFVAAGLVDDATAHAGSASTLRVTGTGESVLARANDEVTRIDAEFTRTQPELAEALRALVTQRITPQNRTFS